MHYSILGRLMWGVAIIINIGIIYIIRRNVVIRYISPYILCDYLLPYACCFGFLNITCSKIITVSTPITKPLPIIGRIICGITSIGMAVNSIATIIGSPIINPLSNVATDLSVVIMCNDAASCVPIR